MAEAALIAQTIEAVFLCVIAYWANEDRNCLHSSNYIRTVCVYNWNDGRKWFIWNTVVLLAATNKDTVGSFSRRHIRFGYCHIVWLFSLLVIWSAVQPLSIIGLHPFHDLTAVQ